MTGSGRFKRNTARHLIQVRHCSLVLRRVVVEDILRRAAATDKMVHLHFDLLYLKFIVVKTW